ncbi:hypothetical protein GUITHDRAFT_56704, partial [Guillardia theta CCMP2712]
IDDHFEYIEKLGKGSYGTVIAAMDRRTKNKVAIKAICETSGSQPASLQLLREILCLRHFSGHENIVQLQSVFLFPTSREDFKSVFLVMEIMDTDLHRIIRSKQTLNQDQVKIFMYQILRGIKFLHSAKVIHRDLKPSNILVNSNYDLKIGDLGLAVDDIGAPKTTYVVTRWYRAPEVLMGDSDYNTSIDIWSVGCILAELLGRRAFFPGSHSMDMIERIVKYCGRPSSFRKNYSGLGTPFLALLRSLPMKPQISWETQFPDADAETIHLLHSCLTMMQFESAMRRSATELLAHSYFTGLHDETDEPVSCE